MREPGVAHAQVFQQHGQVFAGVPPAPGNMGTMVMGAARVHQLLHRPGPDRAW